MSVPYRWTCHGCQQGNEPGTSACAHCGTPALAGIERIERAARHAYIEDSSATAPPVKPEWPAQIYVLDGTAMLVLFATAGALEILGFDWRLLSGVLIAGALALAGEYAKHRERRLRVLRHVAALDAAEELARQRGEVPAAVPDLSHTPPTRLPHGVVVYGLLALIAGVAAYLLVFVAPLGHFTLLGVICGIACMLLYGMVQGEKEKHEQRAIAAHSEPAANKRIEPGGRP